MTVRQVEVDGVRLAVDIEGDGCPPVVFVSALGDDRTVWNAALASLTVGSTVVTYDRPGLGESASLPEGLPSSPRTFEWAAEQLRSLLDGAGVGSPRVLVGHSIGGLIIERYAARWPGDVAGLVFVDSSDPQLFLDTDQPKATLLDGDDGDGAICFDVRSSVDDPVVAGPVSAHPPAVVVSSAVGRWFRAKNPERFAPFSLDELDDRWQRHQHALAQKYDARLLVAHTAGHRIDSEAPALVARAVDAVVSAVRGDAEVRFDAAGLDTAGGRQVDVGHRHA